MTTAIAIDDKTREILAAWRGELGNKMSPADCGSTHSAGTLCAHCGNRPPVPNILNGAPDPDVPLALRHSFWYPQATFTVAQDNPTPPEQKQAIEVASAKYNLAKREAQDALGLYQRAAIRERRAEAGDAVMDPRFGSLEFVFASRDQLAAQGAAADELFTAYERAEAAMIEAQRELNAVSAAWPAKRTGVGALIDGVRERRLMRFRNI